MSSPSSIAVRYSASASSERPLSRRNVPGLSVALLITFGDRLPVHRLGLLLAALPFGEAGAMHPARAMVWPCWSAFLDPGLGLPM